MKDTITRYLASLALQPGKSELLTVLKAIGDRFSSQPLRAAGLEIAAGGSTLAQIGSASTYYGVANGKLVTKAAGTAMPALTGLTITASSYNVACFFIDSASTVTALFGTEATTLAGVKFPEFPENKALVGFLIITHGSTFTGGTTALDTATTVYVSPVGAFDPNVLL
jgi:hypothetical protein